MKLSWCRVEISSLGLYVVAQDHRLCWAGFYCCDHDFFRELSTLQDAFDQPSDLGLQEELQQMLRGEKPVKVRLDAPSTAFQREVWSQLLKIPYGETRSYAEIAEAMGRPGSARAVGGAVGRNPLAYFIPCHRVLPKSGDVGGYRWGSEVKEILLKMERFPLRGPIFAGSWSRGHTFELGAQD